MEVILDMHAEPIRITVIRAPPVVAKVLEARSKDRPLPLRVIVRGLENDAALEVLLEILAVLVI